MHHGKQHHAKAHHKNKIMTAQQAVSLIKSGDIVTTGGSGAPEDLIEALEERFQKTHQPTDLILVFAAGQGDGKGRGLDHLGHSGLLKRVIGAHFGLVPRMGALIMSNKVEAYNLPQGCVSLMFRSIANKSPGVVTKVGLGTYVDPRNGGGKLNARTTEDIVHLIDWKGEEYLMYERLPRIDVAFIRGTTADLAGNISCEREALTLDSLNMALATHNSGGLVLCQVERISTHPLPPRSVRVPGHVVHAVVLSKPSSHWQTYAQQYHPGLAGELHTEELRSSGPRLTPRKLLGRRAAAELRLGAVINLGIGYPEGVAAVAKEEGITQTLTLTTEAGAVGGTPMSGLDFGTSLNLTALLDQSSQFDFYDGGGADVAFLGMGQADQRGNVNVSLLGGRLTGCGGFINISQNSKKVVFMGTFTAGGLSYSITPEGQLRIDQEGRESKFVEQVDHVTFSAAQAAKQQKEVLYITERCVFQLTPDGLQLIEIAPGVELQTHILARMGFKPLIKQPLKIMDSKIFFEAPLGLKESLPRVPSRTSKL